MRSEGGGAKKPVACESAKTPAFKPPAPKPPLPSGGKGRRHPREAGPGGKKEKLEFASG